MYTLDDGDENIITGRYKAENQFASVPTLSNRFMHFRRSSVKVHFDLNEALGFFGFCWSAN
jgi:hypothetical protein